MEKVGQGRTFRCETWPSFSITVQKDIIRTHRRRPTSGGRWSPRLTAAVIGRSDGPRAPIRQRDPALQVGSLASPVAVSRAQRERTRQGRGRARFIPGYGNKSESDQRERVPACPSADGQTDKARFLAGKEAAGSGTSPRQTSDAPAKMKSVPLAFRTSVRKDEPL